MNKALKRNSCFPCIPWFKTSCFVVFSLLFFLYQAFAEYPVGIIEPQVALYVNFTHTGLYFEEPSESKKAFEKIAEKTARLCTYRGSEVPAEQLKEKASEFLKAHLTGEKKFFELFFYYKDADYFAFIFNGEFNLKAIKKTLGEGNFEESDGYITFLMTSPFSKDDSLFCRLYSSQAIFSPYNVSGNVLMNMAYGEPISEKFSWFDTKIFENPSIAFQTDFSSGFSYNYDGLRAIIKESFLDSLVQATIVAVGDKAEFNLKFADFVKGKKAQEELNTFEIFSENNAFTEKRELEGGYLLLEASVSDKVFSEISSEAAAFFIHFFIF